jgi:hypothetical protein
MPRKATRISVSPFQSLSEQAFRLNFGLDMTSKATVKANKRIHTGKITTQETPIRRNPAAQVSTSPSRASIFR